PPDVLKAIGLVTAAAAETENLIEGLVAGCIGVEDFEYGMAVTLHMAMPQRFSTIRAAAEIRLDDLDALDELDELIDRADKAFERRNSVVHHEWCVEKKTGKVFVVKESARKRVESDVIEMTAKMVEEIALELYNVGLAVFTFSKKHGLLPAFPSGPR